MDNLPIYIPLVFGFTTILTVYLFVNAANNSLITMTLIFAWLIFQSVLGLSWFYTVTNTLPPRIMLLGLPALLAILLLFATRAGRTYIDKLDLKTLTILHIVRIPVELVLFWLFLYKAVPELMTFEGRNFDILAGLSAPIVYYFGFGKKQLNRSILLLWNFICLGLLINIVVNAVLSVPTPLQMFAFDQPNVAILYFPFVWLPSCVVPLVFLAHLASIKQLINGYGRNMI